MPKKGGEVETAVADVTGGGRRNKGKVEEACGGKRKDAERKVRFVKLREETMERKQES